ncbi:MAG: cytochrome P460 family protein [Xanthobacteraceae bacterium]|jgi:Cytochrome P460
MTLFRNITVALIVGTAALAAASSVQAQVKPTGEKVIFPESYAQGELYATVDRADNKQYRELYTSKAAVEAAKRGEPLPHGTVITLVQYAAQLDPQGNPVKDANGRFIKTNIVAYTVMEKRAGWGADYPDNIRNGEWEYQAFRADKTPNTNANLTSCFTCHKPLDPKQDFVFSYERLKETAR